MIPFYRQFTTVVLFHFRKSTVMYTLVVLIQNSQSHTDNHIKEMACVDRIPKITESLYHSTIRLRVGTFILACQMDMACQQDYFICVCMQNNVIQCG